MLITAEWIWSRGRLRRGMGLGINQYGRVQCVEPLRTLGRPDRDLGPRVVLPGFVNAHSHAFQRLLRGRTQRASHQEDSFWTWREVMYDVASQLTPEDMRVAARQAFLEMLLCGVTTVGEFHYIHHRPDGTPYDDPVVMADAIAQAALETGIRLCLLRTVYLQGDFDTPPKASQTRFVDASLDTAMLYLEQTVHRLRSYVDARLGWGVAAHSLRGVPVDAIVGIKTIVGHLPFHIHVSEQRREVDTCQRVTGATPVHWLAAHGVLDANTTLVHATHLRSGEADAIQRGGALVCVCPTTESDLGDGLVAASCLFERGIPVCLGTDGQTQSSVLEEARRLEGHERLRVERRNVHAEPGQSVAPALLRASTVHGARSLGLPVGELLPGRWADWVAYDLEDPHLTGADEHSLLEAILFSADSRAVREVMVGGQIVVENGRHRSMALSQREFAETCRTLLGAPTPTAGSAS